MFDPVQLLAIGISTALLLLVVELVRRRLLGEEYAILPRPAEQPGRRRVPSPW